ncbi:hypothetical protein GCM10023349_03790 [Nocardioides conyzicola]|uniref:Glycosyltransferase RgtA/B/C/D-like domain-containing protein n=1 Tax=Nocardioides conyzicola TaxID=1651781 RepID=A0ABP8WPX8_9ACTN
MVAYLAVAVAVVRLPFLALPLSPDEGGYLLVASQWDPGASTYGAYFVDRPPVLIGLFGLADELGGTIPLRLLALVAVAGSVLLAGRLGGWPAAATAAVFLSTPLFDAMQVDGELLAVPFVLGGLALLVRSLRTTSPQSAYAGSAAAGALAACAVLVKQNLLDVFVVAAILLATLAVRGRWRDAVRRTGAFAAGTLVAVGFALLVSATRGTGPAALWDAMVTFRAQAAEVIHTSANSATPDRLHTLVVVLLVSGAPVVALVALGGLRRPETGPDLRWAALALIAWELVGAALGGSYWLHYLLALVPGLVLLTAASRPTRPLRWGLVLAGASTTVALVGFTLSPPSPGADQAVSAYLRSHSIAGDTVVVAFGHPNVVHDSGLGSPYEQLWSLPVRVRDPRLREFARVIGGADAPRWVVVSGGSLATWGVDSTAAQVVLDRHYRQVTSDGDWHVFERR